jgi:hypothetical protein
MHLPAGLAWDSSIKDYAPDPVNVIAEVVNNGNGAARNARFRIVCDTTAFTLAWPSTDVQSGSPSVVSSSHGYSSAIWNLRSNCMASGKESEVCVIASFDNHPDVRCCSKIWIPAADPFPSVTINGPAAFCDGDSVVLTIDPGYGGYLWDTGDTTASITVKESGAHYCMVRSKSGCTCTTNTVTLVKRPAPAPQIKAIGSTPICEGDSVVLDAGTGYVSYLWNTGASTRTITVNKQGAYTCYVEDTSHCGALSPEYVLTMLPVPVPSISCWPSLLCEGDTAMLDAGAGYARYMWSTGEQTRTIRVSMPGAYQVEVENAGGCKGVSSPVTLTFLPVPAVPIVSRTGNMLSTTAPSTRYEWSRNGVVQAGDTSASLVLTQTGTYTVTVFSSNGCSSTSAPFVVDAILSVARYPVAAFSFDVYPEPNHGSCTIKVQLKTPADIDVAVCDILGRVVYERCVAASACLVTAGIVLDAVPAGVYVLRITSGGHTAGRLVTKTSN